MDLGSFFPLPMVIVFDQTCENKEHGLKGPYVITHQVLQAYFKCGIEFEYKRSNN